MRVGWLALLAMAAQALAPALLAQHVLQERAPACAGATCAGQQLESEQHEAPQPAHDESSCDLCRTMIAGSRGGPIEWAGGLDPEIARAVVVTHRADRAAPGMTPTPRTSRGPPASV